MFAKLVRQPEHEGAEALRKGQPWSLPLSGRAPLIVAYRRTNIPIR